MQGHHRRVGDDVRFAVLTTSTDASLPAEDTIDGTPGASRLRACVEPVVEGEGGLGDGAVVPAASRPPTDVVHLHGFSQKSILVVALAKMLGKRVVLTLHTAGQDEPGSVQRQGRLASWAYARADLYITISEPMAASLVGAGVPASRLWRGSNGLDMRRFRPAERGRTGQSAPRARAAAGRAADPVCRHLLV